MDRNIPFAKLRELHVLHVEPISRRTIITVGELLYESLKSTAVPSPADLTTANKGVSANKYTVSVAIYQSTKLKFSVK